MEVWSIRGVGMLTFEFSLTTDDKLKILEMEESEKIGWPIEINIIEESC